MTYSSNFTNFTNAMGFLTRIGPARSMTPQEFAGTLQQFVLVGCVIGAILTAPFALGLAAGHFAVQAWLWVVVSIWLTRGLHWDGWADLWDAWGSCASGERFWEIMKDSRLGAFGGIGLIVGIGGQLLLAYDMFSNAMFGGLFLAPVVGRTVCVILCRFGTPSSTSSLGKLFLEGATTPVIAWNLGLTLVLAWFLIGPAAMVLTGIAVAHGVLPIIFLSRRQQGMNGDMMGAAIIWGEIATMLGTILAS